MRVRVIVHVAPPLAVCFAPALPTGQDDGPYSFLASIVTVLRPRSNSCDSETFCSSFGIESQSSRFVRKDVGAEGIGMAHYMVKPDQTFDFGHRHKTMEEMYVVLSGSGRFRLNVDYTAKNKKSDRFEATDVTFIAFSYDRTIRPGRSRKPQIDTVRFSGIGEWNGKKGSLFEVLAADEGEPGRHRESVSIVVRSASGAVVAQVDGELSGGNVQSRRIHR